MKVAAIDCGTNSIRLLVAKTSEPDEHATRRLRDVARTMRIVRLGQDVDATGRFADEALARTFTACEEFAGIIDSAGVDRLRFVATSATRDAANRDDFLAGVRDRLHVEPEVISGDEEAALSFRGAVLGLADVARARPPYLMVDIGGGSTEFVLGGDGDTDPHDVVVAARSVDIGCVRMTERHLRHDPPTGPEIGAAEHDIDAAIGTAGESVDLAAAGCVVGVAGTVTTLVAAALELSCYDPHRIHHTVLTRGQVHESARTLLGLPRTARADLPYMHPGRVDVIGGGALVLDRVMRAVRQAELVASETDILDGIALGLCG